MRRGLRWLRPATASVCATTIAGGLLWATGEASAAAKEEHGSLAQLYLKDGYVVVPGMFSAAEVRDMTDEAHKILRQASSGPNENLVVQGWIEAAADRVGAQQTGQSQELLDAAAVRLHQPHRISELFLARGRDSRIVDVLQQITTAHLAPLGIERASIKWLQSMFFFRPLASWAKHKVTFHQDEHFIPTRDRSLTAVWVPCVDVDENNGCLWVQPGSHLSGHMFEMGPAGPVGSKQGTSCGKFPSAIPVRMKAGDALFFNGYTVHGSQVTHTTDLRPAFTCHYMSGE
jgi:phytanoyl-CoA hydroxylase